MSKPKTRTCGKKSGPPKIKEEHRRKKLEAIVRLLATPEALITWVKLQMRNGSFGPRKLAAVWERFAEMLFAVIERGFGTLLYGLIDVDAVSDWSREKCVEHMAGNPATAPHLMDFADQVASFNGVDRDRCIHLLTTFLGMSPEDDTRSQLILGVTLAAVTRLGLEYDEERLVVVDDCTHILEGWKRCEASGKTPSGNPRVTLERLEEIKLVNAVFEQHNLRGMTIRKVMRVTVHA